MSLSRLTPQQKKRRKKRIIITVIIVLAVLIAAAVLLMMLQKNITEKFAADDEREILSATVISGSIQTTVAGSGTLSNEENEDVILPALVTLDTLSVRRQDSVEKGDLLATVNTQSLLSAMANLQEQLDTLDEELSDAEEEEVDSTISAAVSGRAKALFAQNGDDVAMTMYENGALMLLSLDGTMSVRLDLTASDASAEPSGESGEIPSAALSDLVPGDSVTVVCANGTEYSASVDRVTSDFVTVLLTDNGPVYGEEVTVCSSDGETLGTGVLDIHEALAITGYAGTVSEVDFYLNEWIDAGDTLFGLSNTSFTARYESLLKERQALEEDLQTLIMIYKEGGIHAPISGKISSVSYDGKTENKTDSVLLSIRPTESIVVTVYVNEADILNISVGQTARVSISSIEDETFTATVTEIDSEGTSSGGVTSYAVTLTMPRTSQMRSGMSVTASISISGASNALILPEAAVQKSRNSYYVYTLWDEESGTLSGMTRIEPGVSGNGYIEILSGLSAGTTVYYEPSRSASGEMSSREMFGGSRR